MNNCAFQKANLCKLEVANSFQDLWESWATTTAMYKAVIRDLPYVKTTQGTALVGVVVRQ